MGLVIREGLVYVYLHTMYIGFYIIIFQKHHKSSDEMLIKKVETTYYINYVFRTTIPSLGEHLSIILASWIQKPSKNS